MRIEFTLDCTDLHRAAAFWQSAAGFTVGSVIEGRYVSLAGLGVVLTLQQVAEPKSGKNRMHLDLLVDDVHAEVLPDKIDTWRQVRFDVIFKGDDWRGTPKGEKLQRDFAAVGVEVRYFPYTMHTSSTILRKALAAITAEEPAGRAAHALSS
jgi:hypothetical protein